MDQGIVALLSGFEKLERPVKPILSVGECREFVSGFEGRWVTYRELHAAEAPGLNVWEIANLHRDEVKNCRVLGWWLDPEAGHFQGSLFLHCFLDAAGELPLSAAEERSVRVRREVPVGGDSRIDLVIETDLRRLWVEAKIEAGESLEQIDRYTRQSVLGLANRSFAGRLLTVGGTSGESMGPGFKRMVWRDVIGAMRRFSERAANPLVAQLAQQYCDFLFRSLWYERA